MLRIEDFRLSGLILSRIALLTACRNGVVGCCAGFGESVPVATQLKFHWIRAPTHAHARRSSATEFSVL